MPTSDHHQLSRGFWLTSGGTLISRVLGMLRDVATAALLGMSAAGGVMDAFVLAFRIPNLFRGLLGEGALATSFLPVFAAEYERGPGHGWRLLNTTLVWLALGLLVLVAAGEAVCGVCLLWFNGSSRLDLLLGLTATMLPYMLLVCLAALIAATLQALSRFAVAAVAPAVLNVCWLFGACVIAPRVSHEPVQQAYVLAGCVLVAGVLQLAWQWSALRRQGFRWQARGLETSPAALRVLRAMAPIALGMAVTRVNTLIDSLMAWALAAPAGATRASAPSGWLRYPLEQGAATAIYFSERLYQLPLGLLGAAVATVIFPLLSRHMARGDRALVATDLTLGLRLVFFLALPAGVGLITLAEPLTRLLFMHGAFTPRDAQRTAVMVACYSGATWAYSGVPVMLRGFYALGDRVSSLKIGLICMVVNLCLNLLLIWPLAEAGLALSTALTAVLQLALLMIVFSHRHGRLALRSLAVASAKTALATLLMALAVWRVLQVMPLAPVTLAERAWQTLFPLTAGLAVFFAAAWLLRSSELALLVGRTIKRR